MLLAIALYMLPLTARAQPSTTFHTGVGIHVGQNRNDLAKTREALERARVTSFRDEVFWHRLETKRGVLAFPDSLRDLDQLVTEAAKQGRRPILILNYGNPLYDNGGQPHSPEAIAAYVRYVRFVVKHFQGRVDQYEVWNEWNIGGGGSKEQKAARFGSPEDYAALLRSAYTAVKIENFSATVVGGAFAGYDYKWIEAFASAGGFNFLDGFSIHPYVFSESNRLPRVLLPASSEFKATPGTPESAIAHVDELKRLIDTLAPGRNIRVYITEAGWPVHQNAHGVTEETAAAYLQRFMLLAKTRPWIAGVWWYDLFDDGDNAQDKEHRFGLLSRSGAPKPALQALADIAPLLQASTAPTVDIEPNNRITVNGQRADGTQYLASWLADGTERMQLQR